MVVSGPLSIAPGFIPPADVNQPYTQTISASGGIAPYAYSLSGVTPTGFSIDSSSGEVTGTPTVRGSYEFSVGATDSDSPIGSGSRTYTLIVNDTFYSENFDAVPAGTLPAGWTVGGSGAGNDWTTVTNNPYSSPNSIFTNNVTTTSDRYIISPSINVTGSGYILSFFHNYDTELGWDGGVLEISINGGAFNDIISSGGIFLNGPYTRALNSTVTNPLAGRQAWTGNSGSYILTSVLLPDAAANNSIQLRWRLGCDQGGPARVGWWVDSITIG